MQELVEVRIHQRWPFPRTKLSTTGRSTYEATTAAARVCRAGRPRKWAPIATVLIAFHFPGAQRHELQAACRGLGIVPTGTSSGPRHEQARKAAKKAAHKG
ncbi:hypothetical protein [Streptomyces erythrochromogenes]|uniref:hypothetical protein n=1 Tax=Streptomyces erythrochromogenes TaxID=285574 RepID=UPI00382802A8